MSVERTLLQRDEYLPSNSDSQTNKNEYVLSKGKNTQKTFLTIARNHQNVRAKMTPKVIKPFLHSAIFSQSQKIQYPNQKTHAVSLYIWVSQSASVAARA